MLSIRSTRPWLVAAVFGVGVLLAGCRSQAPYADSTIYEPAGAQPGFQSPSGNWEPGLRPGNVAGPIQQERHQLYQQQKAQPAAPSQTAPESGAAIKEPSGAQAPAQDASGKWIPAIPKDTLPEYKPQQVAPDQSAQAGSEIREPSGAQAPEGQWTPGMRPGNVAGPIQQQRHQLYQEQKSQPAAPSGTVPQSGAEMREPAGAQAPAQDTSGQWVPAIPQQKQLPERLPAGSEIREPSGAQPQGQSEGNWVPGMRPRTTLEPQVDPRWKPGVETEIQEPAGAQAPVAPQTDPNIAPSAPSAPAAPESSEIQP